MFEILENLTYEATCQAAILVHIKQYCFLPHDKFVGILNNLMHLPGFMGEGSLFPKS